MKTERLRTGNTGDRTRNNKPASVWTGSIARRIACGASGVALSVVLASCGGGTDATPGAVATSLSKTEAADVAAAASAAASTSVPLATSLKMNSSSISDETQTDRFIVKYKSGTSERGTLSSVQSRLDRFAGALPARAHHMRRMGTGSDVVATERKLNATEAKAFMRAIATDPDVEYVEPDTVMTIGSVPNDPLYSSQWALSSNQKRGVTTAGIRAEGAWDMATGSGEVIGVVDSGITSHSDLTPNVLPGQDFTHINNVGDGTQPSNGPGETCAITWHGTHVAGIMAAVSNNGVGIAGIAPAAKIVSARAVTNCNGGPISDVADAITWVSGGSVADRAVNPNPAKVINVSLYARGICQTTLQDAIDGATSRGAIVVAIAGNYGIDAAMVQPASCRNVITVGAINRDASKFVSSDFGPVVDIAAPGASIWSTYNNGTTSVGTEGYNQLDGTSQAAPMVSGVAALVQSVAPTRLTVAEMRTLMQQNVQPFTPKTPDQPIGPGILDATATVAAAKSGKIPAAADFTCSQSTALIQVTCKDLSTARGGAPIVSWAWNFGDGGADMVRSQSVTAWTNYDYGGVRNIKLTVTDSNGQSSTMIRPIDIQEPPVSLMFGSSDTRGFSAKAYDMNYWEMDLPSSVKTLTFTLAPSLASDVAILDVRAGTPSVLHPDCEAAMVRGNAATCTITNPAPGAWYGIVSASSTPVTRATITGTYTQ
jgi:serine protease